MSEFATQYPKSGKIMHENAIVIHIPFVTQTDMEYNIGDIIASNEGAGVIIDQDEKVLNKKNGNLVCVSGIVTVNTDTNSVSQGEILYVNINNHTATNVNDSNICCGIALTKSIDKKVVMYIHWNPMGVK